MMQPNIPQAGQRGRHPCVSVTVKEIIKHLHSPPLNYKD